MVTAVLEDIRPAEGTRATDFADLSGQVAAAGLMRRRPGRYALSFLAVIGLFAAAWVAFVVIGASWWTLAVAVLLAVASTQIGFLGHDVGHRQVFRRRGPSEVVGLLLGNLAIGMSYGWWVGKHTRHHANPNHEDEDPDVGAGALVWTAEQAAGRRGVLRWIARHQAALFVPMLLLEGFALKVASVRAALRDPLRHPRAEIALLALHLIAYVTVVFAVLPVGMGLAFIAVHQALFGLYMGLSFAPNHKGMPIVRAGQRLDFLRKQVLTSRDVTGGRLTDIAYGGLNYQVEHHLFPSMPRPHLRAAQRLVRAFCAERGIPYAECGALESYRIGLTHLAEVGRAAR